MPTYEYECTKGCRFEIEQSIMDAALERCRKSLCPRDRSGVKVTRLIAASNFILKGSGWYADGYSGNGGPSGDEKKPGKAADSSKDPGSKSGSGDSGPGKSKPDGSGAAATAGSSAS